MVKALGSMVCFIVSLGVAQADTLRVLNWYDYIDEALLAQFEAETGLTVDYVEFDSAIEFSSLYASGKGTWDIVIMPPHEAPILIELGELLPFDPQLAPNIGGIDEQHRQSLSAFDPSGTYLLPYMWGTTGLGLDTGAIEALLGPDYPRDFSLIFDPRYLEILSQCGVAVIDDPGEVFPIWALYQNRPDVNYSAAARREFRSFMAEVGVYYDSYLSADVIDRFSSGELCVVMGYSGDIFMAMDLAAEADRPLALEYLLPSSGTTIWHDPIAVPLGADVAAAHQFLDFIFRPESMAALTNYTWYANPVSASNPLIEPDILEDDSIYPLAATMERLRPTPSLDISDTKSLLRTWHQIKCVGQPYCHIPMSLGPGFPLELYYELDGGE